MYIRLKLGTQYSLPRAVFTVHKQWKWAFKMTPVSTGRENGS